MKSILKRVRGFKYLKKHFFTFTPLLFALCLSFSVTSFAMGHKPKTIMIHMKVDFGPAEKPGFDKDLEVDTGSTAKDAVMIVYPVRAGKSCCSLREVFEIGGVAVDPEKDFWWICLRNGSKNFSPKDEKLKPGDRIEWKYIPNDHCPLGKKKS